MPSRLYLWDLNFELIREKHWKTGLGEIICHLIIVQCQFENEKLLSFLMMNSKETKYTRSAREITGADIVPYFSINLTFGTVWEKNPKCSSIILKLSSKSRTNIIFLTMKVILFLGNSFQPHVYSFWVFINTFGVRAKDLVSNDSSQFCIFFGGVEYVRLWNQWSTI